jgi:hypothetical protein
VPLDTNKRLPYHSNTLWGKGKEDFVLVRIIGDTEGHHEVQILDFGMVYKWHSESTIIECECGKRSTYTRADLMGSVITCECSKDSTARVREEVVVQVLEEDQALHPWRTLHYSTSTSMG